MTFTDEEIAVAYTPLRTRLSNFAHLSDQDLDLLDRVAFEQFDYPRGTRIAERGDRLGQVLIVVSGWVARSRLLPSGARQITHVLLPGDIMTAEVLVFTKIDHDLETLTDVTLRSIKPRDLSELLVRAPSLATALWWAAEQEEALLREAIVRVGRRSALESVAHLLLELHRRLCLVSQASDNAFVLPVSQDIISDVLGLSLVHINKTVRKLEKLKLIKRNQSVVEITDRDALAALCDFDLVHMHTGSDAIRQKLW